MNELLERLAGLHPEVDFEVEDSLIDSRILDSFDVVTLVGELMDNFDIEIGAEDMIPENFNSADAIWELIQRKQEEE